MLEEGDDERRERQRITGVLGNGHTVSCFPNLEDPTVQQQQHRAVCLLRPYAACPFCPHSLFTLVLRSNPEERYETVACPRWSGSIKEDPIRYDMTELATCEARPFDFCTSCPSKEELYSIYRTDKRREGWYSRWKRFSDDEPSDE